MIRDSNGLVLVRREGDKEPSNWSRMHPDSVSAFPGIERVPVGEVRKSGLLAAGTFHDDADDEPDEPDDSTETPDADPVSTTPPEAVGTSDATTAQEG